MLYAKSHPVVPEEVFHDHTLNLALLLPATGIIQAPKEITGISEMWTALPPITMRTLYSEIIHLRAINTECNSVPYHKLAIGVSCCI